MPYTRAVNLQDNDAFYGLNIPRTVIEKRNPEKTTIDPVTDLFRTDWPGVTTGPIVSQFLLSNFEIDSIDVEPKADPLFPGMDYMTSFQPWLDVQVMMHYMYCFRSVCLAPITTSVNRFSIYSLGPNHDACQPTLSQCSSFADA